MKFNETNLLQVVFCCVLVCLPMTVWAECSIFPEDKTVDSAAEIYFVNVNADGDCTWGAESLDSWITIEDGSAGWDSGTASGNGFIKLSVEENTGDESRNGAIEIAGFELSISQLSEGSSACSSALYDVEPSEAFAAWEGSTGTISVSTTGNCTWKAVSRDSWIVISDGTSGWEDGTASGDGSITYSVQENVEEESRSGTIRIANHDVTISQEGEDRLQWPCIIKTMGKYYKKKLSCNGEFQ